MKILEEGKLPEPMHSLEGRCYNCNCKFQATKSECKTDSFLRTSVMCPTKGCGNWVRMTDIDEFNIFACKSNYFKSDYFAD